MSGVAYDLTRLLLHYARPTPNGIDRVDISLARHFFNAQPESTVGACLTGARPATIAPDDARRIIATLERAWSAGLPGSDEYARIRAKLISASPLRDGRLEAPAPSTAEVRPQRRDLARLLSPARLRRGLGSDLPRNAIFFNTYHCPVPAGMRWLSRRRDIKPVFFVHDLLTLQFPEYFTPAHVAHERRWHDILADHAAAAVVNSADVAERLEDLLDRRGARSVPVLVAPMPADPVFNADDLADEALREKGYFVICGTIEPRKNHMLVLHVWRELARRYGGSAPKLLVLGRRGWNNRNVVDLLDRSPGLRSTVIEAAGLSSHTLARLIANARALLMPSFGEGYGLPIAEALAAGTRVIASDIRVFRDFEDSGRVTYLHPLDGEGWLSAVIGHAHQPGPRDPWVAATPQSYFSRLDGFLSGL